MDKRGERKKSLTTDNKNGNTRDGEESPRYDRYDDNSRADSEGSDYSGAYNSYSDDDWSSRSSDKNSPHLRRPTSEQDNRDDDHYRQRSTTPRRDNSSGPYPPHISRARKPIPSDKYDDPWDVPVKIHGPSDRSISPRIPSDKYDDPWDVPVKRHSPSDRNISPKSDNPYQSHVSSARKATPSDNYDDPWDVPVKRHGPSDRSDDKTFRRTSPGIKYNDQNHSRKGELPAAEHDYDNSDNSQQKADTTGKYKHQNGHITVDLGPGIYRPVAWLRQPVHHCRDEESTAPTLQGSKPDVDPPSDINDDGTKKRTFSSEDENEERGNWSGRFDFILSMLGYAVGLGNVWRFPYLCYRNGGGAFLFPFLLMMGIIGVPLFYLEASLGQFSSCGATTCWHFAPLFKGLGIAMVMVSGMTGIYYNMILAWALHYMFSSFTSDLPFASCDKSWNTHDCKLKLPIIKCEGEAKVKSADGRCLDSQGNENGLWNKTVFTNVTGRILKSPSQEYWERKVLLFSDGIEHFGMPKWDLVLCLLLAWVICFLCLIKGIKTTGKVVYFTALFPYVVLIILFFRGVTLENAGAGVKYFITPNFERLADANVWKDAANQIFFSMSIAGGGLITLSSYNRFHNNILRDSLIVAFGDSGTCLLGGFVIFSYLGYMAGQLEVGIEDVAADGAGLAFVVYPEAVSNLPPPTLWAVLFFVMLLTLGLDSQFAMIETVLTGVLDQYPAYRPKKTLVILIICAVLFILGLPLTCPGGMYLLQLMDNYVGGMSLIIIGFIEIVAIIYVYGVRRFCQDIQLMTGSTNFWFWKITWCVLSPVTIAFIFIFMFIDLKRSTYDVYIYPVWADVLGWFFTLVSVLSIPVVMILMLCKEREGKNICQKIRLLCLPSVYWGPALPKHRELVDYVEGFQVNPHKDLQSRTAFVNLGFNSSNEALKVDSQASLGASRLSVISETSKTTAVTSKSEKSGISFETSV